jgi:hypothetical protein
MEAMGRGVYAVHAVAVIILVVLPFVSAVGLKCACVG